MIKPLNDVIVFKREEEEEEKTASGIIVPKTKTSPYIKGDVIAFGPGTAEIAISPEIVVGAKILVPRQAVSFLEIDGEEYGMVTHGSTLMVL